MNPHYPHPRELRLGGLGATSVGIISHANSCLGVCADKFAAKPQQVVIRPAEGEGELARRGEYGGDNIELIH